VAAIDLGEFVVGERPDPLEHTFKNYAGGAINLTGYSAKWQYAEQHGSGVEAAASVSDGPGGKATYTWTAAEFGQPGHYTGFMWAGNGTQRYASPPITWTVRRGPLNLPPPTI
jgi:hypothetical protein